MVLREAAELTHEEIDVARTFVWRWLPQATDRAVERTNDVARAERVRRLDAMTHVGDAVRADGLVGMDQVAVRTHHCTHACDKAAVLDHGRRVGVVEIADPLDRQFDEIEPEFRDVPRNRGKFFVRQRCRPDPCGDADLSHSRVDARRVAPSVAG